MSKQSLQEVKCPKTHRLTPQVTFPTSAKYDTLTVTCKSSLVHACFHTHTYIHILSRTLAHSHALRGQDSPPIILVKGFNYTAPTPVINPSPLFLGRHLNPLPKGGRQGRKVHIWQGGPRNQSSPVWLLGEKVQGSRRGWGEKGGGQRGQWFPGSQARYSSSFWAGLATWRVGQRAVVGGQVVRQER